MAEALFDWTVRHIQLTPEQLRPTDVPWQRLLYGRGEPLSRAQIFILLARQQGLEVHMLAYAAADQPAAPAAEGQPPPPRNLVTWIPALRHDGELYLSSIAWGRPSPAPVARASPRCRRPPQTTACCASWISLTVPTRSLPPT